MRYPLDNFDIVSQGFGIPNTHYHSGIHNGTDFPVPIGTPIYAPTDGEIYKVYQNHITMGNACYFTFTFQGTQYWSRFLHLNAVPTIGTYTEGDVIAHSGDSGDSTGAHLHLELWKVPINTLLLYSTQNVLRNLLDPYKWFKENV